MKGEVMSVGSYRFSPTDKLFPDTNIWLYAFGPPQKNQYLVDIYTAALDRMVKAESCIYIDVMIISEYINAYSRIKYQTAALNGQGFKEFRGSPEFKLVALEISNNVKHIMGFCTQLESSCLELKIDGLLDNYSAGNFDFNDQIIAELCKGRRLKLITHDGDFKDQGLSILTHNRRLMN